MGEGGSPPPLPFSVSVIPGNFKSNDFVSADSRGFTAPFFASADSKRLASVEMRERHRVRVSPFCKALSVSFTPHATSAVIVVNGKMGWDKENAQNSQRACETTGKVRSVFGNVKGAGLKESYSSSWLQGGAQWRTESARG